MQARTLSPRQGIEWLRESYRLFRRNPPLLTSLTFAYLFIAILLSLLPYVGQVLLPLALPVLNLMIANGCRALDRGVPPVPVVLADGVTAHRRTLLYLGAAQGAITALVVAAAALMGSGQGVDLNHIDSDEAVGLLLRVLVFALPMILAFWFAPLLVGWHGLPVMKALFFSTVASLRNWRAFALYGLAVATVAVLIPGLVIVVSALLSPGLAEALAIVLRMLMVLVLAPVLMAGSYVSYRTVFGTSDDH